MAEFEAKITGIADLSKAKQDFETFKKSMEQPIKITVDASGFNAVWGNIQKQAQQSGIQVGNSFVQGFQKNIRSAKVDSNTMKAMFDGIVPDGKLLFNGGAIESIGTTSQAVKALKKELQDLEKNGAILKSFRFGEDGKSFTASITDGMNATINIVGRLGDILNDQGEVVGHRWQTNQNYVVDYANTIRQAQTEAQKLSQELANVSNAFSSGTFDANISKMEQGLMGISNNVSSDLVKKASDAAAEYYRITQEISNSLANPNQQGALQGQQLADAYKQAEVSLKTYNNAMTEVRANTQKMLAEGVGARNANQVETWAKNNSKALKQYGDQLQDLATKMRGAQTQGELNGYVNQFKNLKAEITAAGLGGRSLGDQIKNAFSHISQFTGIYALTSNIRQALMQMPQEVIKIDTAMTELRKVSTASASEISDYFDHAADSARKYGQTIDEVIDSTASWTRLGYNLEDATELSRVSALLGQVGSGLDVESASNGLQAVIKGFNGAAQEAEHYGDIINYIADTQPLNAQDIIEGLTRSASSMAAAGNTLEQTIGLIAAGTSVTQDSKSVAQALKTISMRLRGSKTELEAAGEDTEGMATSVSKLRAEMLALSGVDIMVDDSTFKETYDVIDELSYKWQNLTDIQQASITELIAGKRNGNVLNAILSQMSIARETVADANTEAVGSMESQLSVYNESIQASLDKFKVAFQELSYDLINSDAIKGVVDFGTVILRIIDELVKHIGVLGTAITGLGIAKIFTTAVNGAKSVEVASDGVEALSTAMKAAQGNGAGLTGVLKGLSSTLGGLGAKAGGAGSALGGLFSSLGGFLATPAGLGVAAVGAIVGAGVLAYKAYKKQQEELTKQATEATKSWNDSQTKIDEYKQKYIDLNKQLSDSNLSEQEKIGIKQQLLDLQNQITAKYGEQAQGIDLINGGLETQLGILSSISEEEARRNIRDNREAYELAEKEMTRQRTFKVNNGDLDYIDQSGLQEQIVRAFKDSGFEKTTVGFKFTGDATEFESAADKVFKELDKLKDEALLSSDRDIIDGITKNLDKVYQKNDETLQAHRDNYKAYIQQQLYKDGFGDELAEYAKRTQEYNDALFSGDADKINEAKQRLDEYKGTVKEITDAHSEYGDFFDEVENSVNKTTEKVYQFKDIIEDGVAESTNDLSEYSDQIFRTVNGIKKLGLDGVDIQAILGNPQDAMYADLSQLAKLWNPDIDLSKSDDLQSFADFLMKAVYGADAFSGEVDLAKSSFDDFMKSASASIDTLDKVNGALVNSFASGGLSARIDAETGELTGDVAEIIKAYKGLDGFDIGSVFERTAKGIIVNRDALRELQKTQEDNLKQEFGDKMAEAFGNWQDAISNQDYDAADYWKSQYENVSLLASAYDGATSAYQRWLDAQKMGEAGDMYDTVASTAIKRAEELYNEGLTGTNEFRALAQLFSDQDLRTASKEEVYGAYEEGIGVVKKYFTEGIDGAQAFADKLVELDYATKDAQGNYDFYDGIDTEAIAHDLGISVDLVEAAFNKLGDYDFDIKFSFDDGESALMQFESRLRELNSENVEPEVIMDDSQLREIAEYLLSLDSDEIDPIIDLQGADTVEDVIALLQEKYTVEATVDDSGLTSAEDTYNSLVEKIKSLANINTSVPGVYVDIQNDEQVRELAETLLNLDDEEVKAKLGIEGIDTVDGIINKLKEEHIDVPVTADTSGMQVQANTSATVDYTTGSVEGVGSQTAVANYTTGTIEPVPNQTAKLDYSTNSIEKVPNQEAKINYSNGYIEDVPDQSATINYTASISGLGALPDDGEHRTIYIDTVERYKGTVTKSAFQAMSSTGSVTSGSSHANGTLGKVGLKHDETALINELGSEIVVRPSEDSWMIFNDGKPTFAPLKKGDVIFNADLTRQLLEKGEADDYAKILSGNSHSRGTVKGVAHATVKGGGSFKKRSSSSSSKKSSGGGGGGGNGGGGGGSSSSKANKEANDFKETLDKIEIRIDRLDRAVSNLDTVASNTFDNWTTRNKALADSLYTVSVEIKEQQRAYDRYMKQANKVSLSADMKRKVLKGEIGIEDVRNEDTWKKIEEYRKWAEKALECRDAIYKLKVDEVDLWNQRFELNQNFYENQIDQYQHMYDQLDSYIELAENTGRISANKYRLRQIDEENKKLKKLREEYNNLRSTMNSALASGKIKAGSEGYYEMLGALNEISENMADVTSSIAELNKSIRETNWEIFDKGAETISKMNDELEFLYGLLGDEDKMFDDKGIVNDTGITGFGILSAQYNVAMQEAQKYASEIKKINSELAKDPYNQDLIERRQELYDSQRKAIEGANDYKDSIVDLVEEGIKKQIDSLKELISNYTDLMDAQKDEIDYAKKVADAQNNVNKIQKQLNAYANDDTEEGASRRQKLRNDLKNAQDNLAQTEEDRRMSQTKKLLSDLQDEYEDILNARLDDVDALIRAVIDGVDANASIIKTSVETAAKDVGYIMTGDVATIFNSSIVKDLASYFTNGSFVENVTSISDSVKGIEKYITSAQRDANTKASNNMMAQKVLETGSHIQSYTDANGKTKNGYFKDDGTLDTKFTGWASRGGKTYRFNNGEQMSGSQFINVGGKKYRLDSDGSRATNTWRKVGNDLYYFNKDGQALTGVQSINGKKFYFDKNGVNRRGLQTVGNTRYYFNSKSGVMEANVWRQVGNGLYYFGSNGKAASGWFKTNSGKWFFFDPKTNKRVANQWIHGSTITTKPVKGDFYVDANGLRVANGKKKTNKGWLTFDANGKWKGYKTGVRSVGSNGLYWTNEGAPETIIRKSDGAVLTKLNAGDTVLNNNATQNMWDFANNPQKFLKGLGVNNTYGSGNNVNLEFNLSGLRSPSEFMDALRKDKRFEKLIQEMTLGRVNGHGSLAKNAIRI